MSETVTASLACTCLYIFDVPDLASDQACWLAETVRLFFFFFFFYLKTAT